MTSRGIRAPISFGDTSLPLLDIYPSVASISGSSREWVAQDLEVASLVASWADRRGGAPLVQATSSARPTVLVEDDEKFVRFDGVDDFLSVPTIGVAHPGTRIIRFRFQGTRKASEGIWQSADNSTTATFSINSTMTNYAMGAGSIIQSSGLTPNTSWHTAILVYDTTSSVMSVDGTEFTGNTGSNAGIGFQFGRNSGSSATYAQIDIKRAAVLPFAANSTQRAAILAQLA